ncbi:LysR family transcriptional regulator [Streptococcus pyogenes]|uniref:LysR family transcriptional regulator n=1 Tax=Streptococcus pyogenes TaxID=1314 RepID=UPI003DA0E416
MNFNPEHLGTFLAVLEPGSFSEAGLKIGISQPAVSQQIKELERRFQVRLLERVGKTVRPTTAGAALVPHANRISLALADAKAEMERLADYAGGQIRIGAGATACIHLLPPLLRGLKARNPALEIVVSAGNTPDIVRKVEENLLDAALVTLPVTSRAIQSTPVMEDRFLAIAPSGLVPGKTALTPANLAALPLVLFEPGANTRLLVDKWFRTFGFSPRPVMELGSVEAIKEMVAAGLGCALLPGLALRAQRSRKGVSTLNLSPKLARTLAWIVRKDKPMTRALQEIQRGVLGLRP